jgi:hypothetical protein
MFFIYIYPQVSPLFEQLASEIVYVDLFAFASTSVFFSSGGIDLWVMSDRALA